MKFDNKLHYAVIFNYFNALVSRIYLYSRELCGRGSQKETGMKKNWKWRD